MGLVVLDAGPLIGLLNDRDRHHATAAPALAALRARNDILALPASAFAESLVAFMRGGSEAVARIRTFLDRWPMSIVPLDEEIAVETARLRAEFRGMKLPDALVVATAIGLGADAILTTDRRWPRDLPFSGELRVL